MSINIPCVCRRKSGRKLFVGKKYTSKVVPLLVFFFCSRLRLRELKHAIHKVVILIEKQSKIGKENFGILILIYRRNDGEKLNENFERSKKFIRYQK